MQTSASEVLWHKVCYTAQVRLLLLLLLLNEERSFLMNKCSLAIIVLHQIETIRQLILPRRLKQLGH